VGEGENDELEGSRTRYFVEYFHTIEIIFKMAVP
jgi:hypothetical protein